MLCLKCFVIIQLPGMNAFLFIKQVPYQYINKVAGLKVGHGDAVGLLYVYIYIYIVNTIGFFKV